METAQAFTVTGGQGANLVNEDMTVTHAASSTDSDHSDITVARVTDNDKLSGTVSETPLMI